MYSSLCYIVGLCWLSIFCIVLYIYDGFPGSSVGKESVCNTGDPGSIPGLGRSAGEGIGYPLQYSGLKSSTDCIAHGVTKSWTRLLIPIS